MEARAVLRYARISPRKVQIVLDLIRNKPADMAMAILKHTPKAACEDLEKLLKSAMANAENNHNGRYEAVCSRVLRCPGTDPEAHPSESAGSCIQNSEENLAHHPGAEGKGISGRGGYTNGSKSKSPRTPCGRN